MSQAVPLMAGKKGLILGIANDRSLAWGIARAVAGHGADLAVTYQGDALAKRVLPLAESVSAPRQCADSPQRTLIAATRAGVICTERETIASVACAGPKPTTLTGRL